MRNLRGLRVGKERTRKVIPDLWESVIEWDAKASERLERIGIKKPSRKQTRSLLAQFISEAANDSEFEPLGKLRKKRKLRDIFLVMKRR